MLCVSTRRNKKGKERSKKYMELL